MELLVSPTGLIRCVYAEAINLKSLGKLHVERGSHVEPDAVGNWWADLSPVHGPRLGPFEHRSSALAAETDWLAANWLSPAQFR
jgi:hypothetical protein